MDMRFEGYSHQHRSIKAYVDSMDRQVTVFDKV